LIRSVGIASMLTMAVVGVVVATRLVLVARRTRGLPELAMGLGLLLVTVLGGPLAAAARLPGMVSTTLGDLLFGGGLLLTITGIGFMYVFTWRVFRPDHGWAKAVLGVVAGALVVAWLGLVHANAQGTTLAEILPYTRPWGIAVVGLVAGAFLWTGIESLCYHAALRRRLALGMSDPVVVNRFFLWTVSSFSATALCAVIVGAMLTGGAPMNDPLPLTSIGLASVVVSVAWYLAFLPPDRYLHFVRKRAVTVASRV
jgi:hypothetical protein